MGYGAETLRNVPAGPLIQNSGVVPFDTRSLTVGSSFPTTPDSGVGNYNRASWGMHLVSMRADYELALEVRWDSSASNETYPANTAILRPGDSLRWAQGSRNVQMRWIFVNPDMVVTEYNAEVLCRIVFFSSPDAWKEGVGEYLPSTNGVNQPNILMQGENAAAADIAAATLQSNVSIAGVWGLRFTFFATQAMRWQIGFGAFQGPYLQIGVDGVKNTVVEIMPGVYSSDAADYLKITNIDGIPAGSGWNYMVELIPGI